VKREQGFTLLEILVAAGILTMVMTLAFGLFRWIQSASARVTEGRPRDRAVRVVLDRIERELSGAILLRRPEGVDPLAHPWLFYAEDHTLQDQDADRVRFVTQTPLRAAGEAVGRGVRIVSYGIEPGADGLPVLLRSEEEMTDQLEKGIELADAQVVAEDVAAFSLRYTGESGMRDTWDSTSVETDNLLPLDVEVMVQLWQHDAQGQLVPGEPVTRLIEIPTRPEFLEPPGAEATQCENGPATRDCREKWIQALQSLSGDDPDKLSSVSGMFTQVTDPCWITDKPSPELDNLKKALRLLNAAVPECPAD
jgi:general secretion pathway protein J